MVGWVRERKSMAWIRWKHFVWTWTRLVIHMVLVPKAKRSSKRWIIQMKMFTFSMPCNSNRKFVFAVKRRNLLLNCKSICDIATNVLAILNKGHAFAHDASVQCKRCVRLFIGIKWNDSFELILLKPNNSIQASVRRHETVKRGEVM